jgi:hypothetical protein
MREGIFLKQSSKTAKKNNSILLAARSKPLAFRPGFQQVAEKRFLWWRQELAPDANRDNFSESGTEVSGRPPNSAADR